MTELSILMPVYNEEATVERAIERVLDADVGTSEFELVIVDDGSTDRTGELLDARDWPERVRIHHATTNGGKGQAVRTALREAEGRYSVILDADLEYDPNDYPVLLRPILAGRTKVVYGSRFLGEHKAMYFWHAVGNQLLTLITNILFDTTLTDMETCYKVFTRDIADRLKLKSDRWGFDPEITAKIMRMGHRIYEVPISYTGREHWEGKKIVAWKDGPRVLLTLLRYRFFS
jgi:glycosyltransferase involved in cell wall biosynthesis